MGFQEEVKQVKENKIHPVYVVLGKETFLGTTFKQTLIEQVLPSEEDGFNLVSFDMEQTPIQVAIQEAETIPFFGDNKVVFLDNPSFLTGEKKKNDVMHELSYFSSYLDEPSETTVLVIMAKYDKLDERKKIVKQLKKVGKRIDASPLNEKETRHYIKQVIENEGYTISREAFEQLIYLTDVSLSQMIHELDKLFMATFDTKTITLDEVNQLVPKSLEHNIFDLLNDILKKKSDKAIHLYQDLCTQGEETIKINAILISQFRLLLQIKLLQQRQYQQSNMTDVLKIHPYRIKLGVQQAKNYSLSELGKMFDQLVENDFKMKTGFMDQRLLFELFILTNTK